MPSLNETQQVGRREDLSDILVVADAKNTPFTSMAKKGKKAVKTIFDWPVGQVPAPDTSSVPDGQAVDNVEDLSGNRALLHNRVHKLRRVVGCSEFAEDVNDPAGIQSEFANAKANALLAVKRAMEAVFCGDQDSSLVGTTHTCRGLGSWINNSAQTDQAVPAAYRTPVASIITAALTTLTEDNLRAVMQSIYQQTGQMGDWDGLVGVDLKTLISTFTIHDPNVASKTVVRTFQTQLKDNTLHDVIDIIRGDFGMIRLHPTLWNAWNNTTKVANTKRGYVLDMDDVAIRANKLPGFKPLPDDDSGPRGVVSAIISDQVGNPLKHGKLDLS